MFPVGKLFVFSQGIYGEDLRDLLFLSVRHQSLFIPLVELWIVEKFNSIDDIQNASISDFLLIEGIGPVTAELIHKWFQIDSNRDLIKKFKSAGIKTIYKTTNYGSSKLSGNIFVISGRLDSMTRSEAYKKIAAVGGRTSNSVSAKTNYLIAGENPGSKLEMAKINDVPILQEKAFIDLINKVE